MGILIFLLNRISEFTGLYFFSALLQADAAILGILGVFIIFRFQNLQNYIQNLREHIILIAKQRGRGQKFYEWMINYESESLEGKEELIDKGGVGELLTYFEEWLNYEKQKDTIKSLIKLPIILLGIGLILNMIFLSMAEIIYYSWSCYIIIILFTIAYHIFLFINLVRLIFKAVPPVKED